MTLLVFGRDNFRRQLLSKVARAVGFKHILEEQTLEGAVKTLRQHPIDVCVADFSEPSALNLLKALRKLNASPNAMVPIIGTSGTVYRQIVEEARDLGCTEFMTFPVTGDALIARLVALVEKPRQFIQTKDYFGPDRRRRGSGDVKGRRAGDPKPEEPDEVRLIEKK